ncbi:MAG TPA: hypothetical protein VNE63_09425 [Candidatus Acidoferrales bacterium]|nr:hypothetical protein [Candidatus Acidoferrales bacterium]
MAADFTFGAGEERIEVRIAVSKPPSGEKPNSANELDSTVILHLGAFSGSFTAEVLKQDLVILHDQLIMGFASHSATVPFKSVRDDLSLKIEFNGPGKAILSGTAQPHRLRQAKLTFQLEVEQSSLARTAEELEDFLRNLPH